MLNRLNNINGKGSNAVVNNQIKELQADVAQLKSDVDQEQIDIAALDADLDTKVGKADLASEVDTASLKADVAKIDTIKSKDANDVTINDNLNVNGDITSTGKVSATSFEANGVDIVDDYTQKTSCALSDASAAVHTANDALDCACTVNDRLNTYKESISQKVTSTCGEIDDLSVSNAIDTYSLTVGEKASIKEMEAEITNTTYNTFNSKIEPTAKASGSWYHFNLPSKFQGRAHVIGVDANDNQLFTAIIDTAFSDKVGSPAGDREGTGMVIHSGINIYDFYILTRRKDLDQIGFITQADIAKLYFKYDNFDKTVAPTYEIYADLTPTNFDPDTYDTIYTAEHSDQVVIFGSEKTLNGGITILGTFKATAVEIPESILTDAYIKDNIYGGYDCDIGEFTTKGTLGGVLTYNQRSGSGKCNVSWVQGCPRQYPRKGVCLCTDDHGRECSDLEFETVETKNPLTGIYNPDDNSDKLFDEAGLAAYNGVTCAGNYPIVHLGDNTCVHGRIQTAGDVRVEGQIVSEGDTVIHGDLFIDGTSHVVNVEEVQSSGDYEILRSGQPTGIASYAGTIIENYDGTDKHVFIGADCCGEVRVGKNAQTAVTTYTNISDYNSQYFDGLTQTVTTGPSGYMSNVDEVELNNVVHNSAAGTEIVAGYYHWEGVHWFGPLSIVSGKFDLGSIVTNATDIAALDALTKRRLVYYNSVTDNILADIDINQPVLTRNESGNLSSNALLQWDATHRRADAINMPTADKSFLSACVVNANVDHYEWTDTIAKANCVCKELVTDNADRQLLLGAANESDGYSSVSIANECKATFNPATGVLSATCFCGVASCAINSTCFCGCTYECACADFRNGLTSCTGTVTVTDKAAADTDTPVALCTGSTEIGRSTGCALTFNTCTGVLSATYFCGTICGAISCSDCIYTEIASANASYPIAFVENTTSGYKRVYTDTSGYTGNLSYNPVTRVLSASHFRGMLCGTASDLASKDTYTCRFSTTIDSCASSTVFTIMCSFADQQKRRATLLICSAGQQSTDVRVCYQFKVPDIYNPVDGTISINQVCSTSGGLVPELARSEVRNFIQAAWRATTTHNLCKPIIAITWNF